MTWWPRAKCKKCEKIKALKIQLEVDMTDYANSTVKTDLLKSEVKKAIVDELVSEVKYKLDMSEFTESKFIDGLSKELLTRANVKKELDGYLADKIKSRLDGSY